jgi:hypothetical protein
MLLLPKKCFEVATFNHRFEIARFTKFDDAFAAKRWREMGFNGPQFDPPLSSTLDDVWVVQCPGPGLGYF